MGVCTVLALVAGLVASTPANAAPPTSANNFHPQNALLGTSVEAEPEPDAEPETVNAPADSAPDILMLSDRFDGTTEPDGNDETEAHITSVGDQSTTLAIYFVCQQGAGDVADNPNNPFPPANCQEIGRDAEGEVAATGPTGTFTPDKAFEYFWDIPPEFDFVRRDFVSFHCRGNPTANEPSLASAGNCLAESETNVIIDDAQGGTTASSAGALYDWCVDRLGPGAADCADEGTEDETGALQLGDSERHRFGHPEAIPNVGGEDDLGDDDELVVRARFSTNVAAATLCVDVNADAFDPPDSCDISDRSSTQAVQAYAEATFSLGPFEGVTLPDNSEMAFFIYESEAASQESADDGACGGGTQPAGTTDVGERSDCVLDVHYVVNTPRELAETHLHNDEEAPSTVPGEGEDPDTTENEGDDADTFCEDADRQQTGNVPTGGSTELIGCFFDQFRDEGGDETNDPSASQDLPATFVLPDGWSFRATGETSCDGGTRHDHDGDGDFEHCHLPTANSQNAQGTLTYRSVPTNTGAAGGATMTFCHDPQQGQAATTTDTTHGCGDAGAEERATVTKNAGAQHDHTHAVFTEDLTPQCHTGAVSKSKPAASNVSITGCVQDQFHNGAEDVRVIWRIISGPGQFVSVEQETDSLGQADAVVTATAAAEGQVTTVEFCSDVNINGVCDASDIEPAQFACPACRSTVQITWTRAATTPPDDDDDDDDDGRTVIRGVDICNKNRPTANLSELLIGDNGPDKICGFGGRDTLRGLNGKDDLRGGKGKDVHSGGKGQDNERGGKGADSLRGGKHADTLKGGPGRDTARGGPANDLCRAEIERGCEQ